MIPQLTLSDLTDETYRGTSAPSMIVFRAGLNVERALDELDEIDFRKCNREIGDYIAATKEVLQALRDALKSAEEMIDFKRDEYSARTWPDEPDEILPAVVPAPSWTEVTA
jgi:hypothetical protein